MSRYTLTLDKTMYDYGFFYLTPEFYEHIVSRVGPIIIYLGDSDVAIRGWLERKEKRNGNVRILGRKPLQDFFRANFRVGDTIIVEVLKPAVIRIRGS